MQGVFDIIGPIMIGPSSSHTAGAVRLGRMARVILGEQPEKATISLHGSFRETYRGHGTDKAIVAGLLDFAPDDERICDALSLAKAAGMEVVFVPADLGDAHPNTAEIILTGVSGRQTVMRGASVGGGSILVTAIDGYAVELTGRYQALITIHQDQPGVIAHVTRVLAQNQVNIAFMRVSRRERGAEALMIIEVDQPVNNAALADIRQISAVERAILVPALS